MLGRKSAGVHKVKADRSPLLMRAAASVCEALENRRLFATIVVDTLADTVAADGKTSLREAVALANADSGDEITFDASLSGKTITLTQGDNGVFGESALTLSSQMTIEAPAGGITISGPGSNTNLRAFYVTGGSIAVTLANLTIANFISRGGDGGRGAGGGGGLGGAILNAGATVVITGCTFTNNKAIGGNGGTDNGTTLGSGGGLSGVTATSGFGSGGAAGQNGSTGGGGGSGASGGTFGGGGSSNGSGGTFGGDGNDTVGGGGAGLGGAVFNYSGGVDIDNSTFNKNTAVGGTGGSKGQGAGGAIFTVAGRVYVQSSTLAGNSADLGGAIHNFSLANGVGVLTDSPITTNNTAIVLLHNSILSGSTDASAQVVNDYDQTAFGSQNISQGDYNIIEHTASFGGTALNVNPKLAALLNNGGPTKTMAIGSDSPAFEAGRILNGTLVDQRGEPRINTPDIGAFELVNNSLVVTTLVDEDNGDADPADGAGTGTSLREAIAYANSLGGTHTITFGKGVAAQGGTDFTDGSAHTISLDVTMPSLEINGGIMISTPSSPLTIDGKAITLDGTATFSVPDGSADVDLDIVSTITGSGGLVKDGKGLMLLDDYAGLTTIKSGTVRVDSPGGQIGNVSLAGGTVAGTGTIGTVTSTVAGGGIAPGDTGPGILASGPVTLAAAGNASFELGGLTPGNTSSNYDQLKVAGDCFLGGSTLKLALTNGFNPSLGNSFTIIQTTGGTVHGTFANGSSIVVGGKNFAIDYSDPTKVVLTRVDAPAVTAPVFSGLASPTITVGHATTTISGILSMGNKIPTGYVAISIGNATMLGTIRANGSFQANFATGSLALGTYTIHYTFPANNSFSAASATSTLTVSLGVQLMFNNAPVKSGTALPVDLAVVDDLGHRINFAGRTVRGIGIARTSSAHTILPLPAGSPNSGLFISDAGHGRFTYKLSTTGLAAGTYNFYFNLTGDPVTHFIAFTVK